MKVYYAHCTSLYGTNQEARDASTLLKLGFEIYNPNNDEAAELYREEGMAAFQALVEACGCLAYRALPDGRIPAGIGKEIVWAIQKGMPVFELPRGFLDDRIMSVESTRSYLYECGSR